MGAIESLVDIYNIYYLYNDFWRLPSWTGPLHQQVTKGVEMEWIRRGNLEGFFDLGSITCVHPSAPDLGVGHIRLGCSNCLRM